MLNGKKILVGVTASIAAYKAAHLVRELIKAGAHVRVIMTPASFDFITPLTLGTLSKNPVLSDFTEEPVSGIWNNHVELGLWADAFVVAPATANTLSKMAHGACDNLLMATYLSARCPVFYAPAMDLDMYQEASTRKSLELLQQKGNVLIQPSVGELASGLVGEGRMAEPEEIVAQVAAFFFQSGPLKGKKALVSAGPTYEAIDSVRFIGNHASGKMGVALAEALTENGAEVTLVIGPSAEKEAHVSIERVDVVSAGEMAEAVLNRAEDQDIIIMNAAVADYRPASPVEGKIKKQADKLSLDLVKTQDILAQLGKDKRAGQLLVGFALESQDELNYAQQKLKKKNLDFVVMNSTRDEGATFGSKTNKITVVEAGNKITSFELKDKKAVAADVVDHLIKNYL